MAERKIIIGYADSVTGSLLSVNSAKTTHPVSNLADRIVSRTWQTQTGVTSARIICDMRSVRPIGAICMANLNMTGSGTCRIRLSQTDAAVNTALTYDSGTDSSKVNTTFEKLVHIIAIGNVQARYLSVEISDPTQNFLEAGRLWAFRTYRPVYNYAYGWKPLLRDPSDVSEMESGDEFTYRRPKRRGVSLEIPSNRRTDFEQFLEPMQRIAGKTEDLMLCLRPDADDIAQYTWIGRPQEEIDLSQAGYNRYPLRITVFDR